MRSGELFGLREGATRTALSRMTANGEVVADDGHYALAGDLLRRHARQQAARSPAAATWDGTWLAAVVVAERRTAADRSAFRDAAMRLKLAEIREGLWMRPDNRGHDLASADHGIVDRQATWLRSIRSDDPRTLLDAFDLDTWASRARGLVAEMDRWQPALDERRTDALADTFVVDADVVRHLVADPDLPPELVDDDWPAATLRTGFRRFDTAFKETWRTWYRSFQGP